MNAASGTKVKNLALAGLCTAFMAVVAPLSIPIGPISLTLSVLGVFFAGAMLTPGWAAASILAYICIGAVGLPVFANMAAGVQVLTGMTAGFLWAYPLMAALLAAVCRRTQRMALGAGGPAGLLRPGHHLVHVRQRHGPLGQPDGVRAALHHPGLFERLGRAGAGRRHPPQAETVKQA